MVKRPGAAKSEFPEIEIDALDISATDIRALLKKDGDISTVLPPSVANYLKKREIYASK